VSSLSRSSQAHTVGPPHQSGSNQNGLQELSLLDENGVPPFLSAGLRLAGGALRGHLAPPRPLPGARRGCEPPGRARPSGRRLAFVAGGVQARRGGTFTAGRKQARRSRKRKTSKGLSRGEEKISSTPSLSPIRVDCFRQLPGDVGNIPREWRGKVVNRILDVFRDNSNNNGGETEEDHQCSGQDLGKHGGKKALKPLKSACKSY